MLLVCRVFVFSKTKCESQFCNSDFAGDEDDISPVLSCCLNVPPAVPAEPSSHKRGARGRTPF